jgi:hypothetical protein
MRYLWAFLGVVPAYLRLVSPRTPISRGPRHSTAHHLAHAKWLLKEPLTADEMAALHGPPLDE